MTQEEEQALIDQINGYWQNRPKNSSSEEKKKLEPLYDFDRLEFTSEEHVKAVREFYEKREQ